MYDYRMLFLRRRVMTQNKCSTNSFPGTRYMKSHELLRNRGKWVFVECCYTSIIYLQVCVNLQLKTFLKAIAMSSTDT